MAVSVERIAELSAQIEALDIERRKLAHERGVLRKRIARTGKKHTPETRAKIGDAHRGMRHTKAACKRMSQAQKRRYEDPEQREGLRLRALAAAQRRKGVHAVDPIEARIFGGARGR